MNYDGIDPDKIMRNMEGMGGPHIAGVSPIYDQKHLKEYQKAVMEGEKGKAEDLLGEAMERKEKMMKDRR